jgi:hypothetical protein
VPQVRQFVERFAKPSTDIVDVARGDFLAILNTIKFPGAFLDPAAAADNALDDDDGLRA